MIFYKLPKSATAHSVYAYFFRQKFMGYGSNYIDGSKTGHCIDLTVNQNVI